MNRQAAEAEASRLGGEHPERERYRWLARNRGGTWEVVKIPVRPGQRVDPFKTTSEAKPKPSQPDDPRTTYDRNVGGPWVG